MLFRSKTTIARELHDSIAQSLSCMKMQVSCLQMQGDALPESSRELLSQIRNELNASWVQLRELLTTFRLQLTEPGLRPALEASCEEYSAKFGFPVKLDYQLPPRLVPSHQAIHLLQIAREALSNALKHSQASEVVVTVAQNDNQVKLTVQDNGCGVPENAIRSNHYGMIIMRWALATLDQTVVTWPWIRRSSMRASVMFIRNPPPLLPPVSRRRRFALRFASGVHTVHQHSCCPGYQPVRALAAEKGR